MTFNPQPKNINYRDALLLEFTRDQPCIVSKQDGDLSRAGTAHHYKGLKEGGTGLKPPDSHVLPLKPELHLELEQIGEEEFFDKYNIDPVKEIVNNLTAFIKYLRGKS